MDLGINGARFAGSWYPADPDEVRSLFAAVPGQTHQNDGAGGTGVPRMAVLPHAGLSYSARGQREFWQRWFPVCRGAAPGGPEAIVILAPSHYRALPMDSVLGARFSGYETSGGIVPGLPCDPGDAADAGVARDLLAREHAVELLLPALVAWQIDIPVTAVLVSSFTDAEAVRSAARRLYRRLARSIDPRRVLWLVSSDFTHYGSRFGFTPFGSESYGTVGDRVAASDRRVASAASSVDVDRFWDEIRGPGTVCGRFAIALALALLEITRDDGSTDHYRGQVLSYYTSADCAPDPAAEHSFVCYATVEIVTPGDRS